MLCQITHTSIHYIKSDPKNVSKQLTELSPDSAVSAHHFPHTPTPMTTCQCRVWDQLNEFHFYEQVCWQWSLVKECVQDQLTMVGVNIKLRACRAAKLTVKESYLLIGSYKETHIINGVLKFQQSIKFQIPLSSELRVHSSEQYIFVKFRVIFVSRLWDPWLTWEQSYRPMHYLHAD